MRYRKSLVFLFVLIMLAAFDSQACHKFSLTYGRMFVSQDAINIELKIPLEDLILFRYLPVDSSRSYTIDEIQKAGENYFEELRNAISISSDDVVLSINEIRLQPIRANKEEMQVPDVIPLRNVSEHHLSYSIQYKKSAAGRKLIIQQNFGKQYPLIPSLMVLDVDGLSNERLTCKLDKGIEQTLGNEDLSAHISNQIIVTQKHDAQELRFLFRRSDLMELLRIDQIESFHAIDLSSLFEISLDGQVQDMSVINMEWIEEQRGLKFKVFIDTHHAATMTIRWLKFNRSMRKLDVLFPENSDAPTRYINRFNDSISWSINSRFK